MVVVLFSFLCQGLALLLSWRAPLGGALLLAGVGLAVAASRFVAPGAKESRHGPLRLLGVDVFHYLFALALVCMAHGIAAATSAAHPSLLVLGWLPVLW